MSIKLSLALLAGLVLAACSTAPTEFASARHCRSVPLKSAILTCQVPTPQATGQAGATMPTRG